MNRCNLCLSQIADVYEGKCSQCFWSAVTVPINENYNMHTEDRWEEPINLMKNLKRCKKCEQVLPKTAQYFYKNGKTFTSKCVNCIRELRKV